MEKIYGYVDDNHSLIETIFIQFDNEKFREFVEDDIIKRRKLMVFNGERTIKKESSLERYLLGTLSITAQESEKAGAFSQDQVSIKKNGVFSRVHLTRCNKLISRSDEYIEQALKIKKSYIIVDSNNPLQKLDGFMITSTDKNSILRGHICVSPLVHGALLLASNNYDALNSLYSVEEIRRILDMFKVVRGNILNRQEILYAHSHNLTMDLKMKETVYKLSKEKVAK